MNKNDVLVKLRAHREELSGLGVKSLALFGSVARDDQRPESDVDLLVETTEVVGLFEFVDIKRRLEEILGARVDLVSRNGLKPRIRDRILNEAIDAA